MVKSREPRKIERFDEDLERRREAVKHVFTIAGTCLTAIGTLISAIAIGFSWQALEATRESLDESRYQAVYQYQLNLWSLAARERKIAPIIIGGSEDQAVHDAAGAVALDFYAYIYAQLAPTDAQGEAVGLALAGSDVQRPMDVTEAEWAGWVSWSYTIAEGIQRTPDLCTNLKSAYTGAFRKAIDKARLLDPRGANLPFVPICIVT